MLDKTRLLCDECMNYTCDECSKICKGMWSIKTHDDPRWKDEEYTLVLRADQALENVPSGDWIYYESGNFLDRVMSGDFTADIDPELSNRIFTRTHEDGWTVSAQIHNDYYSWIQKFTAEHEKFGKVYGDPDKVIYATSEEAFENFMKTREHDIYGFDFDDI